MKKRTSLALLTVLCVLVIVFTLSCARHHNPVASGKAGILHRQGRTVIDGSGREVVLRGISFGNEVWSNKPYPYTHHNEEDFKRVADMGMNVIRFYMNYKTFEDDATPYSYKDSGWHWLETNLQWAKKHNIYLILNFHVPPGGFQSNGNGGALWNNRENQQRLKALWYNIAKRYATEPAIAGYDLVNEPVVTESITQWQTLAQELADTIRKADTNHLIIVERLNAINGDWRNINSDNNLFLIKDDNTMYTFHFYLPFKYTHQYASWAKMGEGGKYPDETVQEGGGYVRNKAYLEKELNSYLEFGRKNNVPLYLGEFGLIYHCFKEGKGGLEWTADMLDILKENKVHFTYHVYHEDNFGLYYGYGKLPDPTKTNTELIALFRRKLKE
jgi:aryl-phospho-beta-D-glucosidase BglC (GH1 family)